MAERTARESIMDDWKIVSVIIGILGALLGVYFRESMRKAEKQKITAVRLEAYLNEVIREFLEGELKDIFLLGAVLQEKSIEALKKGGRKAYLKVHEDYKKLLEDIRKMIADGPPEIKEKVEEQYQLYRNMDAEIFSHLIKQIEKASENLLSNIGFISDEDAASISWVTAKRVVEKYGVQRLTGLLMSTVYTQEALLNFLENKDIIDKKELLEEIKRLKFRA